MNIAILTQPISANYGCNLQAYALQTILQQLGNKTVIIDRWPQIQHRSMSNSVITHLQQFAKNLVKLCLFRPIYCRINEPERAYFWKEILRFQKQFLIKSHKLYSTEDILKYIDALNIECFIVGSDQVWRPKYNIDGMLNNMFLDFTKGTDVRRIAYAASFGVDQWEYSKEQTEACSELAKAFDAISVREDSGINLCKKHLGVSATHVLDPTMLLNAPDYDSLISNNVSNVDGDLFCYILDQSSAISNAVQSICKKNHLKSYFCLNDGPEGAYKLFHRSKAVLTSIEQWLFCFKSAKAVIVDSFHGAVFSIIYNKPFWVIGNIKRGMARFDSLLKMFHLQSRIITPEQINQIDIFEPIDWEFVNTKLEELRVTSVKFIKDALS